MGKIIAKTTAGEKITLEGDYITLPMGDYEGWEIVDPPTEIRFPAGATVNCPRIKVTGSIQKSRK